MEKLSNEESPNDPESDPYRSLYAAREHLTIIRDRLEAGEECVKQSKEGLIMSACLKTQLGLNYVQTEEISRGQELFEQVLEECREESLASFPQLVSLNQLGIIWGNRGENDKALELLLQGKALYDSRRGEPPPLCNKDLFYGHVREESLRERSFDDQYTHTLFYLAQVYSNLEQPRLSAEYCQTTLSRQLETNAYDPIEWSLNAATISQYYIGVENFPQARHCLASAHVVLSRFESDQPLGHSVMKEKIEQARADLSRCWIKYCIVLLKTSIGSQDGEENSSRQEGEEDTQLHRFEPLEVTEIEGDIRCELVEDSPAAKDVFLFGQKHIERAKAFFTLDDMASEHASIVQDHSQLFKLLSFFESDLSIKCRMHKRRIDMLSGIASEFNPQHFMPLIRQIEFEIGEIYRDMADLKIVIASEEDTLQNSHAVKKINSLIDCAMTNFQRFIDKFEEPIETVHLKSYLTAMLNLARLHSKRIFASNAEEIEGIKKSLTVYQKILSYKSNEEAERVFSEEFEVCKDMAGLLPLKMNKLQSSNACASD